MDKLSPAERGGKQYIIYLSAFFLPVAVFFAVCAVLGLYPFGATTALDLDLPNQYLCYFGYLPSIASGENDLFYTFSKTLGGDMISMLAYYFLSPLNVVFFFTKPASLPAAITFVIAAKIGLCGLSFAVCAPKRRADASVLLFSTAYALMSYNITYASNLMWLDAVYLLPVIVCGMERILRDESPALYALALAVCLAVNYYIGYMVCIFCVLWFAYRLFAAPAGSVNIKSSLSRFALASFFAGGLAAVILVPTFLSLDGTKAAVNADWTSLALVYSPRDLIRKLFSCSVLGNGETGVAPNIYCGILSSAFVLAYFINPQIKRRERVCSGVLLLVLLISVALRGTYIIWHGFSLPAGFPHRNSFLISFVMLFLAWRSYELSNGLTKKSFLLAFAVLAGVTAVGVVFTSVLSSLTAILDLLALAVAFIALYFAQRGLSRRAVAVIFAVIQFGTLFENSLCLREHPHSASVPLDYAAYTEQTRLESGSADAIKAYDSGFYRVAESKGGGLPQGSLNTPMKYAYNGVSHFSSTEKNAVKRFMADLGYISYKEFGASYGTGSTMAADSLLGIKYVYSALPVDKGYSALSAISNTNTSEYIYIYE